MPRPPKKDLVVTETKIVVSPNGHTSLIPEQGKLLMDAMNGDIDEHAIMTRPGPKGIQLKYVSHGYVTDQLNKVFGPFWSFRAIDIIQGQKYNVIEYTKEVENQRTHVKEQKPVREIIVMGELRVRIYDNRGGLISEETRSGSGGKIWEQNISFADALQSAESEALKRAAFRLGRKFGLIMYYDDEERRAEWQDKFSPKPFEIPDNLAKFLTWIAKIPDNENVFKEATGIEMSDLNNPSKSELIGFYEQVTDYLAKVGDIDA